jgi:hypothetical protein
MSPPGKAINRNASGFPASRKLTRKTAVNEAASDIS